MIGRLRPSRRLMIGCLGGAENPVRPSPRVRGAPAPVAGEGLARHATGREPAPPCIMLSARPRLRRPAFVIGRQALAALVSCIEWGARIGLSDLRGHPGGLDSPTRVIPPGAEGMVTLEGRCDRQGRPVVIVRLSYMTEALLEACGRRALLRCVGGWKEGPPAGGKCMWGCWS